jgi:hypothetical protein
LEKGFKVDKKTSHAAIREDSVECLKVIYNRNLPFDTEYAWEVATEKSENCLEYMYELLEIDPEWVGD